MESLSWEKNNNLLKYFQLYLITLTTWIKMKVVEGVHSTKIYVTIYLTWEPAFPVQTGLSGQRSKTKLYIVFLHPFIMISAMTVGWWDDSEFTFDILQWMKCSMVLWPTNHKLEPHLCTSIVLTQKMQHLFYPLITNVVSHPYLTWILKYLSTKVWI